MITSQCTHSKLHLLSLLNFCTYSSVICLLFPLVFLHVVSVVQEVDQRWTEYQSGFSSLLQWTRQHTALMANRSFPHNPVELKVRNVREGVI